MPNARTILVSFEGAGKVDVSRMRASIFVVQIGKNVSLVSVSHIYLIKRLTALVFSKSMAKLERIVEVLLEKAVPWKTSIKIHSFSFMYVSFFSFSGVERYQNNKYRSLCLWTERFEFIRRFLLLTRNVINTVLGVVDLETLVEAGIRIFLITNEL